MKEADEHEGGATTAPAVDDSELLFRSVFQRSPSGIVLIDRLGRIVLANPAFCHFLQYSIRELKGLTLLDITHPDDREQTARSLLEERRGRSTYNLEGRLLRKDGQYLWGRVTASTWFGTDGYPVVGFAIVQDITERVRRQNEHRRETQFLKRVVESAQAIILVLDRQGRIIRFNEYMEDLCGYALDEVRDQDWFQTFAPCPAAERRRFLQQEADPQKQIRRSVQSIFTRTGERRMIQWSIDTLKDADNSISGILSIGIDITDQRRAERQALVEKERSRAILATAPDGIVTIDEHGSIESFSPSAEEMFGYKQNEIVGENVRVLLPSSYGLGSEGVTRNFLRGVLGKLSGVGREFQARHRNGDLFPVHLSVAQMQVGDKRGFCGFIRNLTESKRVEEQLRQSQKMEAVGSLASGIAHDFNNLLMGVGGCVAVALDCVESGQSNRMYLTEIGKAVETGAAITKQLLAFGRKAAVEFTSFQFDQVVGAQEALLRRLLGEDIEFHVWLNAGTSQICADIGQIDQVLMNLAVNARDAMPTGGRLTIETNNVTLATPIAGVFDSSEELAPGDYVSLVVADTGVGMSSETRDHLFEPFYTTKQPGQGSGLGLATVYGIVKHTGGHIQVLAAEPRGTRFEILLPRVMEENPAKELQEQPTDNRRRHETILLCEDDDLVRMAIQYYLEGAGYRVLATGLAADAIDRCQRSEGEIDLLLTDVVLPDLSGDRIVNAARATQPGMQVLYMSAHAAKWLKSEGRIDEELPTLQKPFDADFLLARVAQILDAPKAEDGMPAGVFHDMMLVPAAGDEAASKTCHGRIIVVEDSTAARLGLSEFLKREGWTVATAGNGADALSLVRGQESDFDVLLVDYSLPDMKGDVLAEQIRQVHTEVAVAYMSGYSGLKLDPPGPLLTKPLDLDTLTLTLMSLHPSQVIVDGN